MAQFYTSSGVTFMGRRHPADAPYRVLWFKMPYQKMKRMYGAPKLWTWRDLILQIAAASVLCNLEQIVQPL